MKIDIPTIVFNDQEVIKKHSIFLPSHQWTALLGSSGCGKTTLLKYLAGYFKEYLPNHNTQKFSYHGDIRALVPWMTIKKNIAIQDILSRKKINTQKIDFLLHLMNLKTTVNSYPHELSLGMKKRILLAQAFYQEQSIYLLDEPFSGLDPSTKIDVMQRLKEHYHNKTVFFVTHDAYEAKQLAQHTFSFDPLLKVIKPCVL